MSWVALWPRWKLSLFVLEATLSHNCLTSSSTLSSCFKAHALLGMCTKFLFLSREDCSFRPSHISQPCFTSWVIHSSGHSDLLKASYTSGLILSTWLYGCAQRNDDKLTSTEIGRVLFPNLLICKEKAKLCSRGGGYALGIQRTPGLQLLWSRRCRSDSLSGGWEWRVRWLENMYGILLEPTRDHQEWKRGQPD